MHTAVEAGEVGQIAQCAPLAENEGIEQAHFDIGMAVEGEQEVVQTARVVVVQQQAHAHAAFCGKVHQVEQQPAGNIVAPNVVLQIEAVFGGFDEGGAGGKGFVGIVEQVDVGQAAVGREMADVQNFVQEDGRGSVEMAAFRAFFRRRQPSGARAEEKA
ncbi:hypothetical protein NEILACOT_04212 [Neisseria lactamica ATCC 23970]|uniref:Uncharacterized protein n=1 Tax=Neisseria lactamica ATCC 23970 TaxID=546265 RepID=D0W9J9_NEILA|nr:hypothetical protein NEILACOT_04212 [Neisseria lactamica ATCC 23970]